MGVSTDGQLSFGVVFEEGFEFPWDDDQFDFDIDEWWRVVNGFVNPFEYPFDVDGCFFPGINSDSPQVDAYFDARTAWDKANPLPVTVVNYCSGECPMCILATKHIEASRGYPEKIDISSLLNTAEAASALVAFLDKYEIEHEGDPSWYLSSYWG